ncbi:uncharacterized protein STEHIDRAFT_66245 [Stereum hirsutum FP-91666 SS1]|uniref:uncharacterized protein n=1 Tax=Stereum hirsutum (strain FP-91666) TaxID=721885 RepID=UPI000444A189|nr:uncharacterized protein STEHIDRAFT_66245 [Stereum hirsutum FP-91666 SS1]EIM81608.1 hypothetical protein STEHIDRAFT_66245 [Stereum hirsutum FP-91666 SS1]
MLSYKNIVIALVSLSISASAAPILRREVPQEHSHEKILTAVRTSLNTNNPQGIVDPVFALLGDAAAAAGLGQTTDPDCLQQATADQAFTNAKAANDVDGMVNALIYRALERNSGAVGQLSANCTSVTAVNPEIAALSQHQDPAADGATANNKAVTLALAQQIAAVGGDPTLALESGTFAPGTIGDPTAAGNTCDDANDTEGCIFSQNLLVDDVTAGMLLVPLSSIASAGPDLPRYGVDEIAAAVSGVSAASTAAATSAAASAATSAAATASASSAATSGK